jgi:hypothetical protein
VLNDSTSPGYLAPLQTPQPLEDTVLEDFLQEIFVGLTGLPGQNVFPRWQVEPANLPDVGTDWAALGITSATSDTYAAVLHDPTGNGQDELQRHEAINILVSTYGPNSRRTMGLFRDGLMIPQNRDALTANGMGQVDTGELLNAPEMIKGQWLRRVDMRWTIRRAIWRVYPVLNLLSAQGTIYTTNLIEQFNAG